MALERARGILSIKGALARGVSASAWIKEQRAKGFGYRRQTMLSDWRSESNIKAKTGLAQYVRKDYLPSAAIIANVAYDFEREYMHKVKVHYRTSPDAPLLSTYVNLMNDKLLTPRQVEEGVLEKLPEWFDSIPGVVERATLETVLHRVEA